ncbi:hypothetical protein A3843_00920 [Pseudovibrio exalbescens]|uniref:Methyl-accepting chemotaxis protein n=1 Tax=Pseudovibrio exalbescens TaxID=197461 RepID=A0A1U7JC83_9HYPH|nr:hypothetical protein A3843_00920 [Pseudovibrio exalbescens]
MNINAIRPFLSYLTSISFRIFALSALSIAAVATLSATYFIATERKTLQQERQQEFERLAELSLHAEVQSAHMRTLEKEFLLTQNLELLKWYRRENLAVQSTLQKMAVLDVASSSRESITDLTQGVAAHGQHFKTLSAAISRMGEDETKGLRGALRAAVHDVEDRLEASDLDPLTIKMLMMRRHEKDFIIRGDGKYIERIKQRHKEFDRLLAEAALPQAEKAQVATLMDQYIASFLAYSEQSSRIANIQTQLDSAFDEVTQIMDEVLGKASEGEARAHAELLRVTNQTDQIILLAGVIVLLASIILGFLIARSISRPLKDLTNSMLQLADGNMRVTVRNANAANEIGEMARAVEVFKTNAIRTKEVETQQEHEQARAQAERQSSFNQLANDFNHSVGRIVEELAQSSSQLSVTAGSMTQIAQDALARANMVDRTSLRATENAEMVASAMEEMNASIREINGQVARSANAAHRAAAALENTTTQMTSLSSTTDRIGEVISMISEIAQQTNLLALNATIESARVGEAGKGFAVVASEVKALATETSKATDSIAKLIHDVQDKTRNAADSIIDVRQAIEDVSGSTRSVAAAMEQQEATTQQVTQNITEAAAGTRDVSEGVTDLKGSSQQTQSAARSVEEAAQELNGQSQTMKDQVAGFLRTVRSA